MVRILVEVFLIRFGTDVSKHKTFESGSSTVVYLTLRQEARTVIEPG